MKKFIFIFPLFFIIGCSNHNLKENDELTIQEQVTLIDSILAEKNTPVTLDTYMIAKLGDVEITACQMTNNSETFKFFLLKGERKYSYRSGGEYGSAILLPSEIERFSNNIDSIISIIKKPLGYKKSMTFYTIGGVSFTVTNDNKSNNWDVKMTLQLQDEFEQSENKQSLEHLKEILNNSITKDKQMKSMDELIKLDLSMPSSERDFFNNLIKKSTIRRTPSGLLYEIIEETYGKKPNDKSTVYVNYKGTFQNGEIFGEEQNISLYMGSIIEGLKEGLKLMSPKSKFILYIPSNLAYGSMGVTDMVPPYSTLIYEVELLKID